MTFDRRGFYREVAIRLQLLRKKKEETQQQVADQLGVSRATYANIESGRQTVALDAAWRAAAYFGVTLDRLAPEPVYPQPKQIAGSNESTTAAFAITPDNQSATPTY